MIWKISKYSDQIFSSDSGVSDQYFRRISILFGASAPKFSVRTRSAPESDEERFSRVGSKRRFEYDRGIFFDEVNDFLTPHALIKEAAAQ